MYSETELPTTKADIFEQVHKLIEPLAQADRLSLIRDILAVRPIQKTKQDTTEHKEKVIQARQERRQKLKEGQMAWYRHTDDERQQYSGQYVALYQGDVIDSDVDRQTLSRRVRQQFGRRPIPIIPAEQSELPIVTFHSPRLIFSENKVD